MTKIEFLEVVDTCINREDIQYLVVAVEGVGEKEEIIINPKENMVDKRAYYHHTYNDNMELIHNPNIKIVYVAGWTHFEFMEAH